MFSKEEGFIEAIILHMTFCFLVAMQVLARQHPAECEACL